MQRGRGDTEACSLSGVKFQCRRAHCVLLSCVPAESVCEHESHVSNYDAHDCSPFLGFHWLIVVVSVAVLLN